MKSKKFTEHTTKLIKEITLIIVDQISEKLGLHEFDLNLILS